MKPNYTGIWFRRFRTRKSCELHIKRRMDVNTEQCGGQGVSIKATLFEIPATETQVSVWLNLGIACVCIWHFVWRFLERCTTKNTPCFLEKVCTLHALRLCSSRGFFTALLQAQTVLWHCTDPAVLDTAFHSSLCLRSLKNLNCALVRSALCPRRSAQTQQQHQHRNTSCL